MVRGLAAVLVGAAAAALVGADSGAVAKDSCSYNSSNCSSYSSSSGSSLTGGPGNDGSARFFSFKLVAGFFGLDSERETASGGSKLTVVGAGFSRTGTKSLEAALVQLGHKVYDIRSMLQLGHVQRWEDAALQFKASGNMSSIEVLVQEMEALGYTATLDLPMNLFAPHLARLRPESKVLMSVRPSEDSWVEAWATVNRILGNLICRPWVWFLDMNFNRRLLRTLWDFEFPYPKFPEHIWRPVPWFEAVQFFPAFGTEEAKEEWKQLHRRLQTELQAEFPERFATFDVRSGWAPLLAFLEVPEEAADAAAATPFPRVNDRGSLEVVRTTMDVIAMGLPLFALIWLFGILSFVRVCFRRCRSLLGPGAKAKEA